MTAGAFIIESCDLLAGRVAGTATQFFMESIERPASAGMDKRFLFLQPMTFGAIVCGMAVFAAYGVNFLHAFA